jgi:hypothetical protein
VKKTGKPSGWQSGEIACSVQAHFYAEGQKFYFRYSRLPGVFCQVKTAFAGPAAKENKTVSVRGEDC